MRDPARLRLSKLPGTQYCLVIAAVLALSMLALACVRPTDRPLSGAPPPSEPGASVPLGRASPPPTLAPPELPTRPPGSPTPTAATPTVTLTPDTTLTPSVGPIVTNFRPPSNTRVPAGDVTASASIIGFARLAHVSATLNEREVTFDVIEHDERTWLVTFALTLEPGEHFAHVEAQDDLGRSGEGSWRFLVVPPATATPTPSATPVPSPTPTPTLVPTETPIPTPTATPTPAPLDLVRGMRAEEAVAQLERAGYRVAVEEVQAQAPRGIVVDQSPDDGTVLPYGAEVTLSVSLGRDQNQED